ncbi:MAG TPA: hypothetical protein VF787_11850 [Thermoanaerobaculia bacterium]
MILAVLLLVGATFSPKSPTIGDLVTIEFPAPVKLEASRDYEVISSEGKRVVVRTFTPKPFDVRGTMNGAPVRVTIPVASVIKPGDLMSPAALVAPRPTAYPRGPFIAIAIAALVAILAWVLVFVKAKKRVAKPVLPPMSAEERFRKAVLELQMTRSWGRLADATRVYLSATRPDISTDLTTTELVPRLRDQEKFVAHILRQGDVEKFSRRKPDANDFDEAAKKALELAS